MSEGLAIAYKYREGKFKKGRGSLVEAWDVLRLNHQLGLIKTYYTMNELLVRKR